MHHSRPVFSASITRVGIRTQASSPLGNVQYQGRTRFISIDTDLPPAQPLMTKHRVRGLPTFILLDERGQEVSDVAGWPGEQAMEETLNLFVPQDVEKRTR